MKKGADINPTLEAYTVKVELGFNVSDPTNSVEDPVVADTQQW